jgi:hypothetical protein
MLLAYTVEWLHAGASISCAHAALSLLLIVVTHLALCKPLPALSHSFRLW